MQEGFTVQWCGSSQGEVREEPEAAAPVASSVRKCWPSTGFVFYSVQDASPLHGAAHSYPTATADLLSSVNLVKMAPHRHSQGLVLEVGLDPAKLVISVYHICLTENVPISLTRRREGPTVSVVIICSCIQECSFFQPKCGCPAAGSRLRVRFSLSSQLWLPRSVLACFSPTSRAWSFMGNIQTMFIQEREKEK